MDKQVGSVLKEVKETIQTIPSTIENRVDLAMKALAQIDESQSEVRRKLTKVWQYNGADGDEDLSRDSELSDDEEKVDEVPLPILPKTMEKMKARNRYSSFYEKGNIRASAVHPKLPLDTAYVLGCNDDLLTNESSSTHH